MCLLYCVFMQFFYHTVINLYYYFNMLQCYDRCRSRQVLKAPLLWLNPIYNQPSLADTTWSRKFSFLGLVTKCIISVSDKTRRRNSKKKRKQCANLVVSKNVQNENTHRIRKVKQYSSRRLQPQQWFSLVSSPTTTTR